MAKRIFNTTALPVHWIVEDEDGAKWLVPAIPHGWEQRRRYRGNYELDECTNARIARQRLLNIGAQ